MTTFSYQLYSSRNFPDVARQCAMVAKAGYGAVEPYGGLLADIDGLEKALKDNGLTAPTCHIGLQMLRDDFAGTVAKLKRIGTGWAIVPAVPPAERAQPRAGWEALGAELSALAKRLAGEGLALGWHNHAFEFEVLPDGTFPIEHVLGDDANLLWEMDIAWVVRGKTDPRAWIARYRDRIRAFHVKDIAPAGTCTDEDGWADVGTGTVDFAGLLPVMRSTKATIWVAEHDNPKDDARFASRSIAALSRW